MNDRTYCPTDTQNAVVALPEPLVSIGMPVDNGEHFIRQALDSLLAQLERIDDLLARKRQIYAWYRECLAGVSGLSLNFQAPGTMNTYWMVTVILDRRFGLTKERVIELMSDRNVDCRPFFHPLSSLPAYEKLESARRARRTNRASYDVSAYGVNLPSALNMTPDEVGYVSQVLRSILGIA